MANRYRNYGLEQIRADSSPSQAARADDHTGPILVQADGLCPCGCGQQPKGKNAKFAMGHDARYRGILMRAFVAGLPVTVISPDAGLETQGNPREMASDHGWEHYLDAAKLREEARHAEKLERANKKLLDDATRIQVGDRKLIKVGRWEYTGQVVAIFDDGNAIEFQYVTKNGDRKRTRKPKAEAAQLPSA